MTPGFKLRSYKLVSAVLTISLAIGSAIGLAAPARAAMNFALADTVASSNFSTPTWTTRGGGYIWVAQTSGVKKISESTHLVVGSLISLNSTPNEISWDGTSLWALLTSGYVARIAADNTVSYTSTAICTSSTNNDSIAASPTQIIVGCFSAGTLNRVSQADLSLQESTASSSCGRVVIAGSYFYATSFAGGSTFRYPLTSLAAGGKVTISTSLYTNSWHRVASDSNYVWITNANSGLNPRLTRIKLSDNTFTNITLSTTSTYDTINSITSDGSYVYITDQTLNYLLVVDISTSTVTQEISLVSPKAVTLGSDGLWVSASGTFYRYTSSSIVLPATVNPTAPGSPTGVAGTLGNTQVSLSWTAPGSNGGSSITDYLIEYLPAGGSWTSWSHTASTSTTATITGLTNGTSYTFRVSAINSIGTSTASTVSAAVVPAQTPGAPTLDTVTVGNAQAVLSWTAPASNGGASISDYLIQYLPSGGSWTSWSHTASTSTTATVTGLTNGTSYTFRVSAINAAGTGTASTVSSSYTPATTPGAPTSVLGTRGNSQVSLSWAAPASTGGSAITDYLIEYLPASGSWSTWSHTASTTASATITGLTNGTSYTFRVSAINAKGTSAASTVSSAVIPATTPDAPTGVTAAIGNTQVSLSWTAPTSNGGSAITDYLIEYLPASGSWTTWSHTASTSTSATITGLTNGTSYTFRVSAKNTIGTGNASNISGSAVPATTPGSPTSVNGTRGAGQVTVSWTAPVSVGGSAITDYLVEYRAGSGSWITFNHTASTATSITVTGLTNGTSYTFRVSAINGVGTSTSSTVSSSATPLSAPDAPTNLVVTSGDSEVSLTWSAPAGDGGSTITDYLIEFKIDQGSWVAFSHNASTDTVARVTGLTNGSAYTFRVSAINAVGTSNATSESASVTPNAPNSIPAPTSSGGGNNTPTPPTTPKIPTKVEVSPTDKTKIQTAWNPVPGAVRYRVTLKPTKGEATVVSLQSTEFKFNAASSVGVTISVEAIDANEKSTDVFSKFVFTPQSSISPAIRLSSASDSAVLIKAAKSMPAGTSLLVTIEYSTKAQKLSAIKAANTVESRVKQVNKGLVIATDVKKVARVSLKPISVLTVIKPELIKP